MDQCLVWVNGIVPWPWPSNEIKNKACGRKEVQAGELTGLTNAHAQLTGLCSPDEAFKIMGIGRKQRQLGLRNRKELGQDEPSSPRANNAPVLMPGTRQLPGVAAYTTS